MKKGFVLGILALLLMTSLVIAADGPHVYIKMDADKKAVVKFVDPVTFQVHEEIPITQDYPGLSATPLPQYATEVDIRVYIKDRKTGNFKDEEGELVKGGPFSTTKDLNLDYRGGLLKVVNFEETLDVIEESANAAVETTEEPETSPISGNVISNEGTKESGSGFLSGFSGGLIFVFLILLGVFVLVQRRTSYKGTPEEKDVKLLESQVKRKGKAITKIKDEVRRKQKAEAAKRKLAVELAKEDMVLSQLNASERDLELKSEIDKEIDQGRRKGEFY